MPVALGPPYRPFLPLGYLLTHFGCSPWAFAFEGELGPAGFAY